MKVSNALNSIDKRKRERSTSQGGRDAAQVLQGTRDSFLDNVAMFERMSLGSDTQDVV